MQGEFHVFRNAKQFSAWFESVMDKNQWPFCLQSQYNIGTRSLPQNAAMHKHFQNIADGLNELGIDQKVVFDARETSVLTKWSGDSVKESLYRPLMFALTKKKSTTQLNKMEVSLVDEKLDMWFAENFPEFEYPPFPNRELLKDE